jgi:3-oxoacyl-[acyl-carrier protein] reductase
MSFLQGKAALVTGGSKGIGLAIAKALADQGAQVMICGRDQAAVDSAVSLLGSAAAGVRCDVGKESEVGAMFAELERRFGFLDILVNNAGIGVFASVAELAPEQWRAVIDTNLSGPFYCSRLAIPLMKRRGGGYIFNISSLAGKNAFAGAAAYNASKFGLNGFSEALMLDVRYDNIRVSYIMPGSVETEFGSGAKSPTEWKLRSEDVADTVLHLLRLPDRALASRVEMRPLQPPRK